MQYSDSYSKSFLGARAYIRRELKSIYVLISAAVNAGSSTTPALIEDAADLLTTYNELVDTDLFFTIEDFRI